MSSLRLAGPDDLDRLEKMVTTHHAEAGIAQDQETRRAALAPLLQGAPQGAVWLIGPRSAPVGYVAVSFGWSIEMGGLDATIDEFFIREKVRRRGMGGEALLHLSKALAAQGVRALHLEVAQGNAAVKRLYSRLGFEARDGLDLMSRKL